MRKRISTLLRSHRRQVIQSALVVGVATSAAALVVASRQATGAVRPPEPVSTRAAGADRDLPGETVAEWRGRIHATAMLSNGAVQPGSPRAVFATVTVGADRTADARRAPVDFVLVVDRSGSMSGRKIEDARRAALSLVDRLEPDDRLAVVLYNDAPYVAVPIGRAAERRESARAVISALEASGGTAIGPALALGLGALGTPALAMPLGEPSADRVTRLVLVSDGIDESGMPPESVVTQSRVAAERGVAVSTIGIGADYNESLMTRIADASFGNYHFLPEASDLGPILARELGEMGATVARDVVAEVELPRGVSFVRAHGAAATEYSGRPVVALRFGSLFGGDERRAVLELRADAASSGRIGDVRTRVRYVEHGSGDAVSLSWKALALVATSDSRAVATLTNPAALEEGVEVTAAWRHDEAKLAYERGDVAGCNAIAEDNLRQMRSANASLDSAAVAAQIAEYEGHVSAFNSAAPTSEAGRLHVKEVTVSNRGRWQRDR